MINIEFMSLHEKILIQFKMLLRDFFMYVYKERYSSGCGGIVVSEHSTSRYASLLLEYLSTVRHKAFLGSVQALRHARHSQECLGLRRHSLKKEGALRHRMISLESPKRIRTCAIILMVLLRRPRLEPAFSCSRCWSRPHDLTGGFHRHPCQAA